MTEPEEALLWAREIVAVEYENFADPVSAEWVRRGSYDRGVVIVAARAAYRAGQAASAERIKALEEALRGGLSAASESYRQAVAEVQGYDRVAERHDQFVVAWKAKARALLKEANP
jgi:hypothetical protein